MLFGLKRLADERTPPLIAVICTTLVALQIVGLSYGIAVVFFKIMGWDI